MLQVLRRKHVRMLQLIVDHFLEGSHLCCDDCFISESLSTKKFLVFCSTFPSTSSFSQFSQKVPVSQPAATVGCFWLRHTRSPLSFRNDSVIHHGLHASLTGQPFHTITPRFPSLRNTIFLFMDEDIRYVLDISCVYPDCHRITCRNCGRRRNKIRMSWRRRTLGDYKYSATEQTSVIMR